MHDDGLGRHRAVKTKETRARVEFFEWIEALVMAFITVVLLLVFAFRVAGVEGTSMEPTLHSGDRIIISDLFFTPKRGDIVVVTKPNRENKNLVKRIVALGGETISLAPHGEGVYIDGALLSEPYLMDLAGEVQDLKLPLTVPPGHVFVMGDNRYSSKDSRSASIGTVDERYLLGRFVIRVLPLQNFGPIKQEDGRG